MRSQAPESLGQVFEAPTSWTPNRQMGLDPRPDGRFVVRAIAQEVWKHRDHSVAELKGALQPRLNRQAQVLAVVLGLGRRLREPHRVELGP